MSRLITGRVRCVHGKRGVVCAQTALVAVEHTVTEKGQRLACNSQVVRLETI